MHMEALRRDVDSRPRPRRRAVQRAVVALAFAILLPTSAAADGFVLVHADADTPELKQQRNATAQLLLHGAEPGPETYEYLSAWGTADRWTTTVPSQGCRSGAPIFNEEGLAKILDGAETDAQFGKFDRAGGTLDALIARLGCATGEPSAEQIYKLWFLRGAVAYHQGSTGAARRYLARAALVPGQFPFDESWPPALHELLAEAKTEIRQRPSAPLVVLHGGAVVRLDGAVLASDSGRVVVPLTAGVHLVQIKTPTVEKTLVLDMEGIPLRPEIPALTLVDGPSFRAALEALEDSSEETLMEAAAGVLLAEAASRDASWAIVVSTRAKAKKGDSPRVFRVDPLARSVAPFSGAKATSDRFSRRLRVAFAFETRSQGQTGKEEGFNYVGGSISLWGALAPAFRVGASVTVVGTNQQAPMGSTVCCALPSAQARFRVELPKGIVRPYGEVATGVLWPMGEPTVVVWTLEGGGGVVFVPGTEKRIGVNVGVLAGNAARIGGYVKLRIAAEVRF